MELSQRILSRIVVNTSEDKPVFLLQGKSRSYMRLSPSAYELLKKVEEGVSFEKLAESINGRCPPEGRVVTEAEVELAYRKLLERIEAIEARSNTLSGAFWFRRELISEALVKRISAIGVALYHPVVVVVLVTAIIGASALFVGQEPSVDIDHFWAGYGLFILSLLAHELGHASACARFGAKPSEIGFTFYLVYPAFYSDVSAAWGLKRWQRVVVDLGGVYFQLVVGVVFVVIHAIHPWEPLRTALLFIAGSCVFSLNPVLKFDGYWVVADTLGVTNLGRQPMRLLLYAVARLRGRPTKSLPWSGPVTFSLALYTVLAFSFWIFFLSRLGPLLATHAADYSSAALDLAVAILSAPPWPSDAALRSFFTSTYMLLFVAVLGVRVFRAASRRLAQWLGRRRARAKGEAPDANKDEPNPVPDT